MNRTVVILALAAAALLGACGSDSASPNTPTTNADGVTTEAADALPDSSAAGGTVAVHIQDLPGFFIEGFEVGLRLETGDGETIAATLWSDFVSSQDNPTIDDYYDSVLIQPVLSGDVVVFATANVGTGPGPEIPKINGDLRCRLDVDVPEDGRVGVEVTFDDPDKCLRLR